MTRTRIRPRAARLLRAARAVPRSLRAIRFALARRRRARHGQHARPRHLEALRALSRQSQGEVLRAVAPALQHHAAVAVRHAAGRQIPADRRHPRHHARLQRRGDGERRARRAGHADGCDRPFRRAAGEVGRQGRVSRRQGEILRRLHAEGREAHAGLAAAEARHREGAADRHHRGAARRQDPSRQGQGDGAGRAASPRRTSRRC